MSVVSNRYATKIFSEHPVALWPIDDDAYFLSLISLSDQDLTTWDTDKCSVTTSEIFSISDDPPFKNQPLYYIIGDASEITSVTDIEIFQLDVFQLEDLNEQLKTFCINLYIYQDSSYVNYYEFGYRYFNSTSLSTEEVSFRIGASQQKGWINLNETFDVSQFDSETAEIFVRANVNDGGLAGDYNFIINGLSIGQWSESFSSKNLGSFTQLLPADTDLSTVQALPSEQYGPLSNSAYYIVENGRLLAVNNSVPMVFGSENSTSLYPTESDLPSFIFPGEGFLSERGRYRSLTLEFWLRIDVNTNTEKRIFGPLDSDYGIYVSESQISLVFGNQIATHNIQNWYRPMLVHLVYSASRILLLINSEEVIEIQIDQDLIDLPSTNEWLGFYSYSDIRLFQIDCVSIFPYEIPATVAKRRFVWGQGVESQEIIDSSFKGKTASINFANANYAVNAVYPDKERWDAGSYSNVIATTNYVEMPDYALPNIFLSGRDVDIWYEDNKKVNDVEYLVAHPNFITFRPNLNQAETEWQINGTNWTEKCYLQFSSANILGSPISSLYGIFELKEDIETDRPLIHIVNALSGKRFEININSYDLSYSFDGVELFSVDTFEQEHVVAGIHIPTLSQNFGYDLASFFASYENLEVYVGGAPDTVNTVYETFEGKIYKVSFSNESNYSEISNFFNANGFANYDEEQLFGYSATYTLAPFEKYNRFFLDISVSAYWEEYFPLYYFAKYITLNGAADYYDLDFLQFNVGYQPYIEKTPIAVEEITPEQIFNNQIKLKEIDFSKSSIKTFATFQLMAEGANEPMDNFPYTKQLDNTYTVDAALENSEEDPYKAYRTKFYIKDGSIIYPPKNISIEDVAIVIHMKIDHECILTNPIQIRNMEISSRALDLNSENPISTKFGKNVYPYTKSGIYFNYKNQNSVLIGKENSPYLYLTDKSGIEILQPRKINKESGILIPINESRQEDSYISAMQIFIKNNIEDVLTIDLPIFEIESSDESISFMISSDESQERYRLYAINKLNGEQYSNVVFYKNGIECQNVYLEKNEWNCISLSFTNPLNVSSYTGSMKIYSGITFNNFSYFLSEGLDEIATIIPRIWSEILSDGTGNNFSWRYWYGTVDENISPNTSFESDLSGYSSPQTLSLNTNSLYSYQGQNSALSVISNLSDTEVISVDAGISVESGQSYIITAKFYVPSGSPLIGKTISISGEGGSGYTNSSESLAVATLAADKWVTARRKIVMSSTSMPKISAELNNTTGASSASIYIDDIKIEKLIVQPDIKKWRNLYVLDSGSQYALTPADIFSSYIGTNNNPVDDGFGIGILNDDFTAFSEILWSTTVGKPA